jgi:hypothetical protein
VGRGERLRGEVKPSLEPSSEPPKVGDAWFLGRPGEGGTWRDMSTAPCFPVNSASDGRSFIGGDKRRDELSCPRFRLRTLVFAECPFINGELALAPPTSVLVLIPGWPMTEPALDVGRDWATPA